MHLPAPSPGGLAGWVGVGGGEAPELQVRRGCAGREVILTCVLLFVGISFTQLFTGSHRGAAGLSLGPCRAQPRLVQRTIEHHVGQNGDFQLLFRPAVLFGKFEL